MSPHVLNHNGFIMEISIAPTSTLKPHEETIPEMETNLMNQIIQNKMFKHPIIVDKQTNIILDGMHRHKVALRLKLKFIPVIYVSYDNPSIKILRWWRAAEIKNKEIIIQLTSKFGFEKVDKNMLEKVRNSAKLVMLYDDEIFINNKEIDSLQSYKIVKLIEDELIQMKKTIQYIREDSLLLGSLVIKPNTLYFTGKNISKHEVKENALKNQLFPHKSTCHVFPARVYNINIDLELLKSNKDFSTLETLVTEQLSHRLVKYIPKPCIYENEIKDEACYEYQ
ncbi:MAG: ParB N-terminal domain-containing protein [Thermoprotei archaeon]